jgi:hypothetical protein
MATRTPGAGETFAALTAPHGGARRRPRAAAECMTMVMTRSPRTAGAPATTGEPDDRATLLGALLAAGLRLAALGALAAACVSRPLPAQVRPIVEAYGTWSDGTAGRGADRSYDRLGGLRPTLGMGLGIGVMTRRFDFVGFGETGAVRTAGVADAGVAPHELTRIAFGGRVEVPVARLPLGFRGVVATSFFVQELSDVAVREGPAGTLRVAEAGDPDARRLGSRSLGGRLEAGVEHRALLGTGWFALLGITAVGGASGTVRDFGADPGGVRLAPTLSVGVRSRSWW